MKYLFLSLTALLVFNNTKAATVFKYYSSDYTIAYLNDTSKKMICPFPLFKLGFGQTRIPVPELFLRDPTIEMSDFSDRTFIIKHFTLTLLSANGTYESNVNVGPIYTEQTLTILKKAKPNDKIIVDEIAAYDSQGELIKIPGRSIFLR